MIKTVKIIGGGLAGCECAYQLAKRGVKVKIYEMKPKFSPAHKNENLAEIEKAYEFTSRKQLKEINDLCIKFSLINKAPKEQIEELDALLNRYQSTLLSLDTLSNQKYLSLEN